MSSHRHIGAAAALGVAAAFTATAAWSRTSDTETAPQQRQSPVGMRSADVLALLPEGEEKRRFVLDCTGCHQFDAQSAYPKGVARSRAEWDSVVTRMLRYAGATTRFPVISAARNPAATAEWLTRHLPAAPPAGATGDGPAGGALVGRATVTEFALPEPRDLPHDIALDAGGRVIATGMMTDRIYVLDPATAAFRTVAIPVPRANPRALEIDRRGRWWVVLGAPNMVARFDPADSAWRTFDVGMYAHSVALAPDGSAWVNGHFTRAPELIARVDEASGQLGTVELPPHPTLGAAPGGPIPYEIRAAPNGVIWMSELHGNRLVSYDPRTKRKAAYEMPVPHAGPRRFDVDRRGVLWVPAYGANALVRFDPRTRRFTTYPIPVADAVPYVARVDQATGAVWVGTSAADAVLRFDPAAGRFTTYPLPSRGALVRHLALDPRTRDVWVAYGASPGIPARIARLSPR